MPLQTMVVFTTYHKCKITDARKKVAVNVDAIVSLEQVNMEESPNPDTVVTVEATMVTTTMGQCFPVTGTFDQIVKRIQDAMAVAQGAEHL